MNRRSFLNALWLGAATLVLDPERLLWVPGAKTIFIPTPKPIAQYVWVQIYGLYPPVVAPTPVAPFGQISWNEAGNAAWVYTLAEEQIEPGTPVVWTGEDRQVVRKAELLLGPAFGTMFAGIRV